MSAAAKTAQNRRLRYMWDLLYTLVARDMKVRYKRSVLGILWTLLNPLTQLLVFGFVFRFVLPVDIPNFITFLFCGVLAWNWFQASLFQATSAIVDNRELIKQSGFPTAILPAVTVTSHLVHFVLSLPILLLFVAFGIGEVTSAILLLPLVIALQFILTLGMAYSLASVHVKFRDTQYLLGVLLNLLFFLTPIFYDTVSIPVEFQQFYFLNPMVHVIAAYRAILVGGKVPDLQSMLLLAGASVGFLVVGYAIFSRTRHRFVDEL